MSFALTGLTLSAIGYLLYKFTRHGTTAEAPLFRTPFLKPIDFEKDPVYGETPRSEMPLPARQVKPPAPSLIPKDKYEPAPHNLKD